MKKNFRLWIFVFILSFCVFSPKLNAEEDLPFIDPEVTISMDLQDASLKDILKIFSVQSGTNFIASEAVQDRKVTLYLDKVSLKGAIDKLFKANNLSYELDRASNIFIVKDWGKPQVETVTKIFCLKYATVSSSSLKAEMSSHIAGGSTSGGTSSTTSGASGNSSGGGGGPSGGSGKWAVEENVGITKIVKNLLSEHGSVIEDYRTNSLIVTDIPSRMPIITQTIAALDLKQPQLMLEVEMLDVSKNVVDRMGVNWSGVASGFTTTVLLASKGSYFPWGGSFPRANGTPTKTGNDAAGKISFSSLTLVLEFLRTQTDTKYLARPRLMTLNNETAEIKITTQESVGVTTTTEASTGTTTATPERAETGVLLRVTPQVNIDTGEITMFIYPQVSEATAGTSFTSDGEDFQYRDPEVRSTKTMVRVKDGDTVIVGGLIRNELTKTSYKIPILSDIPLIGALFRHQGGGTSSSDKNKERELLVFITPHIISDANIELAQAKKASLPTREQGTTSGIDRLEAMDSSLNNFERKKK